MLENYPLYSLPVRSQTPSKMPSHQRDRRDLCRRCRGFNWRYHFLRHDRDLRAIYPSMKVEDAIIDRALTGTVRYAYEDIPDPLDQYPLSLVEIPYFHASSSSYYIAEDRDFAVFKLGSWMSVMSSAYRCAACRLIRSSMRRNHSKLHSTSLELTDLVYCWSINETTHSQRTGASGRGDLSPIIIQVGSSLTKSINAKSFFSIVTDGITFASRTPAPLGGFDPLRVKLWLRWCREDHEHRHACRSARQNQDLTTLGTNLRVFDVKYHQVVIAPPDVDYIALSYVWGQVDQHKLLSTHLDPICGNARIRPEECSRTIRDAIAITSALNERYLWVDTLCIVQDDIIEKRATIHAMHHVYENAKLTIIAADGVNANSGILTTESNPRYRPLMEVIEGVRVAQREEIPDITGTPWNQRAWTYQEFQLSRRTLIFTNNQAFFSCRSQTYGPALPYLPLDVAPRIPRPSKTLGTCGRRAGPNGADEIREYANHVEQYSARELTFEEDGLDAFAAICGRLAEFYDTEFCWGLPTKYFHQALCWEKSFKTPFKRRAGFARGIYVPFPSWCVSTFYNYFFLPDFKNTGH